MPKPTKPEIELAVAGQKAKASTYNDNFQTMLDYVDDCMDYAVTADLANLNSTGEAHFDTRYLRNTQKGANNNPIYIDANGVAQPITQISSTLISNSGVKVVTEAYADEDNPTEWYRVWSDGWIEQGGKTPTGTYIETEFLKPFSDTNYTILTSQYYAGQSSVDGGTIIEKTATTFKVPGYSQNNMSFSWYACGY